MILVIVCNLCKVHYDIYKMITLKKKSFLKDWKYPSPNIAS